MENERELLELAAHAAGIKIIRSRLADPMWRDMLIENSNVAQDGNPSARWRPHDDDGDCARMEAALGIDLEWAEDGVIAINRDKRAGVLFEDYNNDRNAARRMASLRVAAEIGRAMQPDKR